MQDFATIVGIIIPLVTIAGSALAFVIKVFMDSRERRRNEFYELMKFLDEKGSIAAKVAAVYEMRRFPEHRDFIIRFCTSQRQNIEGSAAQILGDEMKATADFMSGQKA
ncbi:MAG: hypothetical protein ACK4LQ_03035 [Pararhodobacter sp.]